MAEPVDTKVTVLTESLYGEENTLAGWMDWLRERFAKVPEEYRDKAVLEIDSIGGYERYEHHTEATIFYWRPETEDERKRRRNCDFNRLAEAERLSEQWKADAEALRAKLARGE